MITCMSPIVIIARPASPLFWKREKGKPRYPVYPNGLTTPFAATPGSSRPGILVLINDADWELEGEEAYELQPRDNILFVSTLHGG